MADGLPLWQRTLLRTWSARGPLAHALRPIAAAVQILQACNQLAYRKRWRQRLRLPVPVVVVGNVLVGGAGKTPTILALVAHLRQRGWTPGVISRGHGGEHGRRPADALVLTDATTAAQAGDEPVLIHRRAKVPVAVSRNRVEAGRALLRAYPQTDILLSDDGLQHLRLGRDVEVLVFDERGAGNGWTLPAGPLREPADRPADLVLFNADHPTVCRPGHLAHRAPGRLLPLSRWLVDPEAQGEDWRHWAGREVLAMAGIARPQRFFDMLRAQGLRVQELALPDHHGYDGPQAPWADMSAQVVVTTEKDAVKLQAMTSDARLWVATLDFQPSDAFFEALDAVLHARGHRARPRPR